MENNVTDSKDIMVTIDGKKCVATVGKIKYRDFKKLSASISKVVGQFYRGEDINPVELLDEAMQNCVLVKVHGSDQVMPLDELDLDAVGAITDALYDMNFLSLKKWLNTLSEKINSDFPSKKDQQK